MLITFMHNKQAILWEEILTPFEGASADPGSLVESKQDFKPGSLGHSAARSISLQGSWLGFINSLPKKTKI